MVIETPNDVIALKRECIARVRFYVDLINKKLNMAMQYPRVEFGLKGTTAGRAYYREHKVSFQPLLMIQNADDFLTQTAGHEVGHLAAFKYYGVGIKAHGNEWQKVMWMLNLPAKRCHNYDTGQVSTKIGKKPNIVTPYTTNGLAIRPVSVGRVITFD